MKSISRQPAKVSYFFDQGYRDVANAIRTLWTVNAQTSKQYHDQYETYGLMSFKGVWRLFCSLSVIVFGTIFSAAISLATLLVLAFFFMLIYIGFTLVWLFDRYYLIHKKIFTACNECKSNFLIPVYICPQCGAEHTNLTPGKYGILHRTCNCGRKLPTTFFNGRRKLTAKCPVCAKNGRVTILFDRESRPLCVPIVGGRSVGKTAFITAFSRDFIEKTAPARGLRIEQYNAAKQKIYAEIRNDYDSGATRMTDRPQDIHMASSVSFSFFVKHPRLHPERLIHVYDIAGEVFTDSSENEVQKQYEYCQGIVLILDPFSIPSVRYRYEKRMAPEDLAGIGKADINGIINVFINKLRAVTGLSDRKMARVPLAVVIGKADSAGLGEEFSAGRLRQIKEKYAGKKEIPDDDAMDFRCREFLIENGMQSFVNTIDIQFRDNRFFVCSAIGHARDHGEYRPSGVSDPMEWIIRKADKSLGALLGDRSFSRTPVLKNAAKEL